MLDGGGTTNTQHPPPPHPPSPPHNSQHFMYLNIHIWYEFETCARYSSWQKLTNNDVIVLVTRLEYNLHTRNKMATLWQSRDLHTIYRPDRKWGPDFVSQVLCGLLTTNFDKYVRMRKKITSMTSSLWSRDLDKINIPDRKWVPDLVFQVLPALLASTFVMLRWQRNYIHNIIMIVTWLGYSLQTR